jgi:stage II sporulation protein D
MKKYLFRLLLILSIIIFSLPAYSAEIDDTPIRAGILTDEFYTTLRAQSFSGHWKAYCHEKLASGSTQTPSITEILVAEGEDLAVSLTEKGIICDLSTGKEYHQGFEKVVFKEGELLNLEIPENRPILIQGNLEVHIDATSLIIVNNINFHQFLVSSVSMFGISSEIEALKAMIVMARTRLKYLKENSRHKETVYEVCGKEHCLPFRGSGQNRELVSILVGKTKNEIINYKNRLIFPRYHHTCGGKISSAKSVFKTDDEPYHVEKEDRIDNEGSENCFHSPSFHWAIELSKLEILEFIAVGWAGGASRIFTGWEPKQIDSTGRILTALLRGRIPKEVDGVEFYQKTKEYFGQNSLKSMRFSMEVLRRSVIFRGMGEGLGVGMCLYGADGLAKKGWNYKDILKFYYKDITIK